ncbi:MAG: Glycerol kinase [Myxococcota bacterium]|nr:Glycerol kinase [Myxococcota bacterium]
MAKFILAIDQGTTSSRAIVFNEELQALGSKNVEYPQIYPKPGWVEHNPLDIWNSSVAAIRAALKAAKIKGGDIGVVGITNQRETAIIWDRATGEPIHNAIVWQCRRTAGYCRELTDSGFEEEVRSRTGLVIDPYFSGTKVRWILQRSKSVRSAAARGRLAFGTVDAWLVWRLSGGRAHMTDASNASRTMLFNIRTLDWDDVLLNKLEVPREILPEVRGSSEVVSTTSGLDCLPDGVPIAGIAGDQQAALFGQGCFGEGEAKCTFGTGAFLLLNTGARPVDSKERLLTTVAWKPASGPVVYALEGSVFVAGAAVQWLRDNLKLIKTSAGVEALARTVDSTGEVVFVPALTGIGAPYWDASARGVIAGMSRDTGPGHIARAALEGIAFQTRDLIAAMERDTGRRMKSLRVDGGASGNGLLMQFLSDILDVQVVRPAHIETTALGAASLAGLATGVWKSQKELLQSWKQGAAWKPSIKAAAREQHLAKWRLAVRRARLNAES